MELIELQAMWQQYDAKLNENTRVNKEILKRMLTTNPERRVTKAAWQAGARLLVSFIVVPIVFLILPKYTELRFNSGIALYIGALLYIGGVSITYYWAIKLFRLLRKINFTNPVTTTKKIVNQIENLQTKELKIGSFAITPFLTVSVFLLFDMRGASVTFLLFFFAAMIITVFLRFKKASEWFKKLNAELDEIETLEK